jgi:hypothetical protein
LLMGQHRPVNIYLFLAALSRIGFNKKEDKMKVNWKDHIVSTPDVIRGKPRIKGTILSKRLLLAEVHRIRIRGQRHF